MIKYFKDYRKKDDFSCISQLAEQFMYIHILGSDIMLYGQREKLIQIYFTQEKKDFTSLAISDILFVVYRKVFDGLQK